MTNEYSNKKLLILDINGLLLQRLRQSDPRPLTDCDANFGKRKIYLRPYCTEFVNYCLENFIVGIWSSALQHNVDFLVNLVFKESAQKLAFVWDQKMCTNTGFILPDTFDKPIFLKELSKVWMLGDSVPWRLGDFGPWNTLLVDDSPYKTLNNPHHTAIFPPEFDVFDEKDDALAHGGLIRSYLNRIKDAVDVRKFIKKNPLNNICTFITDDIIIKRVPGLVKYWNRNDVESLRCAFSHGDVVRLPFMKSVNEIKEDEEKKKDHYRRHSSHSIVKYGHVKGELRDRKVSNGLVANDEFDGSCSTRSVHVYEKRKRKKYGYGYEKEHEPRVPSFSENGSYHESQNFHGNTDRNVNGRDTNSFSRPYREKDFCLDLERSHGSYEHRPIFDYHEKHVPFHEARRQERVDHFSLFNRPVNHGNVVRKRKENLNFSIDDLIHCHKDVERKKNEY